MTHKEYMTRLCHIIHNFCEDKLDHTPACFCGCNQIAKIEIEKGVWRESEATLDWIEDALKDWAKARVK